MHMRKLHDDKSEFSYLQVLVVHKTSNPNNRRCKLFYVCFSPHQYTQIQDFHAIPSLSSTEVLTQGAIWYNLLQRVRIKKFPLRNDSFDKTQTGGFPKPINCSPQREQVQILFEINIRSLKAVLL
jgi:hypothetical protein